MKIAVLMGGTSTERDVSLASGAFISESLRAAGHSVAEVDIPHTIARAGDGWEPAFTTAAERETGRIAVAPAPPTLAELAGLREVVDEPALVRGLTEACERADVVFIGLHGGAGEDGRVQAILEVAGIVHTGAEYVGCSVAFNKSVSKPLMLSAGVPTPAWRLVRRGDDVASDGGWSNGMPVVVKPAKGGSTLGVSLVTSEDELPAAVERTLAYDSEVLVEEFVEGREFTVGIVGGEALPVIEIRMDGPMFDYESKYQPGKAQEICPAPVEEEHALEMQRLAERVHRELKLGAFAYSRIDFRLTPDGRPLCLEANVLPGMTPHSLIRLAAETAGMSFPEFCDRIVGLALRRAELAH